MNRRADSRVNQRTAPDPVVRRHGHSFGEMAEWPIVQHWKCCVRETVPGVRIPLSPLADGPIRN